MLDKTHHNHNHRHHHHHHHKIRQYKQSAEIGILEKFSPVKFGKILPTDAKKKKDVFTSFRPHKGDCLTYDISQTELRMNAGDTRINVKQTLATYVPAPPDVYINKKYKSDQAPPYKFINEIWLEQQDVLQEIYKDNLRRNIKRRKRLDAAKTTKLHKIVMSIIGPDWYQELSPNQTRAINDLQCSIVTDIRNNTITNVEETLDKLGLNLRPNHRHIKKALRLCCRDPVEFLLILYQLINPLRTEYSLNDRLLLSGVVHLTMTETLRELHVRVPSPPVIKKNHAGKPKVEKKVRYSSPYLQPLVFEPDPPKHSGVYENQQIQYPESPYFTYVKQLLIEREVTEDIFNIDITKLSPEEVDLVKDMREAQLMYDTIQKGKRVKLIKPRILKQCEDASKFFQSLSQEKPKPFSLPPLSPLNDSDDEECFCSKMIEEETCCVNEYITCECLEECDCNKKSRMFTLPNCRGCLTRERKKTVQRMIKGITVSPNDEVIPIIEGTILQKTCDCLETYQNSILAFKARNRLESRRVKYIIGGIAITSQGPVYILSTALKKTKTKVFADLDFASDELNEVVVGKTTYKTERKVCTEREKGAESNYLGCTCKGSTGINKSTNTISVETGCCTCKEDHDDEADEEEPPLPCDCEDCDCKEKSKIYTGPRCKKCQEKQRQKYLERIISGMKETDSHKLLPIIEGTRMLQTCDCLKNYAEAVLSMEARKRIQSERAQYVISGVAFTSTGPVYILSTALQVRNEGKVCCKPKKERICAKPKIPVEEEEEVVEEEEEEETDEENLKYSGCKCKEELEKFLKHKCTCEQCNVKQRRLEATYIMGGAKSTEDGEIVNIVHGVHEQRCDCLQRYQEKIDKLEEYRRRIEARYNLKSQTLKFSIGGVVNTPTGPVYMITGMRPPVDCACGRALRQKEEEEKHLQQMAKMPPTGRIKYQITGVKGTPEGNIFIISQALAIEDCDCVKLYDSYIQAHHACLDSYEAFLRQINEDLEQYMTEAAESYKIEPNEEEEAVETDSADDVDVEEKTVDETGSADDEEKAIQQGIPIFQEVSGGSHSHYNLFKKDQVVVNIKGTCAGQKLKICSRGDAVYLPEVNLIDECACLKESSSESSEGSQPCLDTCPGKSDKNKISPIELVHEPLAVKGKPQLKRFVILKEIPKNPDKQIKLLKKVLAQMAEDGFPLAKLPQCYKLPHFKLWMHLRTGKFWRKKDIASYDARSKWGWGHTDACPIKCGNADLGMDVRKATQLTWRDAKFVKKYVAKRTEIFLRNVNQQAVQSAREFFSFTYHKEFPNKTFKDVYFAYLPSKEMDTHAFRLMKPHEARIIQNKYSCYC